MLKLHLGCGAHRIEGWENHDMDVDLTQPLPWADGAARFILMEHVLEHFGCGVAYRILEECRRVLAPGGVLRLCVPDVVRISQDKGYSEFMRANGLGKSGVQAVACNWGHQMLWSFSTLSVVLEDVGFAVAKARPRHSLHPELCNLEGHHKVVGEELNDVETLVVEATRLP